MSEESASATEWLKTFNNIKSLHDLAFNSINEAIRSEEKENPLLAIEKYKETITFIDQAMKIVVTFPENPDNTWNDACDMIRKLKQTRAEVLTRINCLKAKHETPVSQVLNPAESNISTYAELATALHSLEANNTTISNAFVIYSNDNVQCYHITKEGVVSSTTENEKLTIFGTDSEVPNKFLQVGNWIYPLVPGVSPCFKTQYNGFIFPDIHSEVQGTSVGIVLPDSEAEIVYDLLSNILHGVVIEHPEPSQPLTLDEKISAKIVAGAKLLASGLVATTSHLGNFLDNTVPKYVSQQPTTQAANIPCYIRKGAKITEVTTGTTAQVMGFVADKIGLATSKLGQYLAPHIQTQGTRLLQSTFNYSEEEASKKVKGVLTIASGAVEGFSTVYCGLEMAGTILGNSIRDNTVKVVESKYGGPAGDVAQNTMNSIGNVMVLNHLRHKFTPTGLLKQTTKDTGKAVIFDNKT